MPLFKVDKINKTAVVITSLSQGGFSTGRDALAGSHAVRRMSEPYMLAREAREYRISLKSNATHTLNPSMYAAASMSFSTWLIILPKHNLGGALSLPSGRVLYADLARGFVMVRLWMTRTDLDWAIQDGQTAQDLEGSCVHGRAA